MVRLDDDGYGTLLGAPDPFTIEMPPPGIPSLEDSGPGLFGRILGRTRDYLSPIVNAVPSLEEPSEDQGGGSWWRQRPSIGLSDVIGGARRLGSSALDLGTDLADQGLGLAGQGFSWLGDQGPVQSYGGQFGRLGQGALDLGEGALDIGRTGYNAFENAGQAVLDPILGAAIGAPGYERVLNPETGEFYRKMPGNPLDFLGAYKNMLSNPSSILDSGQALEEYTQNPDLTATQRLVHGIARDPLTYVGGLGIGKSLAERTGIKGGQFLAGLIDAPEAMAAGGVLGSVGASAAAEQSGAPSWLQVVAPLVGGLAGGLVGPTLAREGASAVRSLPGAIDTATDFEAGGLARVGFGDVSPELGQAGFGSQRPPMRPLRSAPGVTDVDGTLITKGATVEVTRPDKEPFTATVTGINEERGTARLSSGTTLNRAQASNMAKVVAQPEPELMFLDDLAEQLGFQRGSQAYSDAHFIDSRRAHRNWDVRKGGPEITESEETVFRGMQDQLVQATKRLREGGQALTEAEKESIGEQLGVVRGALETMDGFAQLPPVIGKAARRVIVKDTQETVQSLQETGLTPIQDVVLNSRKPLWASLPDVSTTPLPNGLPPIPGDIVAEMEAARQAVASKRSAEFWAQREAAERRFAAQRTAAAKSADIGSRTDVRTARQPSLFSEPPSQPPGRTTSLVQGGEPPQGSVGSALRKAGVGLYELMSLPRAMKSALDAPALRYLRYMLPAHPQMFWEALAKGVANYVKPSTVEKRFEFWMSNPYIKDLVDNHGLTISNPAAPSARISKREEGFISRWADKVPWLNRSNRAQIGMINEGRAKLAINWLDLTQQSGQRLTPEIKQSIADAAQNLTGRATGNLADAAQTLFGDVLFSTRFQGARFQALYRAFDPSLPKAVRADAARMVAGWYGLFAGVTGAAYMAAQTGAVPDMSVRLDPRQTGFGRIKIGNWQYDLSASDVGYVQLVSDLLTGKRIPRSGGESYDKPFWGAMGDFFQGKMSPLPGRIVELKRGENIAGRSVPFNPSDPWWWTKEGLNLVVPIGVSDLQQAFALQHALGVVVTLPGVIGAGVNYIPPALSDQLDGRLKDLYEGGESSLQGLKAPGEAPTYRDIQGDRSLLEALAVKDPEFGRLYQQRREQDLRPLSKDAAREVARDSGNRIEELEADREKRLQQATDAFEKDKDGKALRDAVTLIKREYGSAIAEDARKFPESDNPGKRAWIEYNSFWNLPEYQTPDGKGPDFAKVAKAQEEYLKQFGAASDERMYIRARLAEEEKNPVLRQLDEDRKALEPFFGLPPEASRIDAVWKDPELEARLRKWGYAPLTIEAVDLYRDWGRQQASIDERDANNTAQWKKDFYALRTEMKSRRDQIYAGAKKNDEVLGPSSLLDRFADIVDANTNKTTGDTDWKAVDATVVSQMTPDERVALKSAQENTRARWSTQKVEQYYADVARIADFVPPALGVNYFDIPDEAYRRWAQKNEIDTTRFGDTVEKFVMATSNYLVPKFMQERGLTHDQAVILADTWIKKYEEGWADSSQNVREWYRQYYPEMANLIRIWDFGGRGHKEVEWYLSTR